MSYTFSELKQTIQDYCENQESSFVSNLPNFIKNAEDTILHSVDLELFKKNVSGELTSGNKYLSLPTDFLASFSLSFIDSNSRTYLLQKDANFLEEYSPNSTVTGKPIYYAYFDVDNIIVAPTPDSSYDVELHYYYRPVSLTAAGESGTTWLSTNASMALLYGSLIEANIYMKGEQDVMQVYMQQYMQAVSRLKDFAEGIEETDKYRSGSVRRQRT
tara:strand:- start:1893 stop:2540 length:648 start_codon:yes stop_codon:yes gene_type:complete